MGASPSGIITLFVVLCIGPACVHLYQRFMANCVNRRVQSVKSSVSRRMSSMSEGASRRVSHIKSIAGTPFAGFNSPFKRFSADANVDFTASMITHHEELGEKRSTSAVLFGLIGFAVGLGNVYKFPFTMAKNGGGAAVIMYLISLVLVAYPLFFYEMVVGFFIGKPALEAWTTIRPRWIGLSIGQLLMMIFQMGYFSVVASYCLIYLVGSCQDPMPWTAEVQGTETNAEAAIKYFEEGVINKFSKEELANRSPGELGGIQGPVVAALFVTWFIGFISMAFGKKIVHEITKYTVLGPVILMIIMVATATTLPGARDGIQFYIGRIDPTAFGRIEVWAACLGQVLFSLGPGYGIGLAYASTLEDPKINLAKMCAIVAGVNAGFSIFSGFYTFSVVGNVAYETGKSIEEITKNAGQGLAFVVAPVALLNFGKASNIMSVLFFLMLFSLGIDTIFAYIEGIADHFHGYSHWLRIERYVTRFRTILAASVVLFLTALPYATRLSGHIMNCIDFFTNTLALLLANFVMVLAFNLDFRYKRINITILSTENHLNVLYGRATFHFFAPIGSLFLAIYLFVKTIQSPAFDEAGLESLNKVGWAFFAIILVCFASTGWVTKPTHLPPLQMNLSQAKKLCEHVHQEKGCLSCVQYAESIKRSSGGEAGPELELKDDSVSGEDADADAAVMDEDEEVAEEVA